MSKSRRNTVDPDDIIASYGADTARWFMLSDSPPERDVIWTEEGVQGAWRFVQRLWRLVREAAEVAAPADLPRPPRFGEPALASTFEPGLAFLGPMAPTTAHSARALRLADDEVDRRRHPGRAASAVAETPEPCRR